MPGSGQVEQVTVRFQADINQYIQAIAQATKAIQGFATGAEGSTAKAMNASVKVVQAYSKVAQESGKVAIEQAKVTAATDKAAQSQENMATSTVKSASSMTNMSSALRGIIGQYLSLGIAIRQIVNMAKEGMDFNIFMEVSTTAFGVMMKSVDAAKTKMKELFDYAVNSPLTFKDTVSASRQLMAYGFSAKELIPTINTLGIVAKATGVQLGDMAYVYGTLRSQGRAYTRDLMQFAMRGIPIYEELAKVVGKPVAELQKMTEAGKIGFKEVEQAFANMTTGTGRFAGFFEEYMKTYEGKMSMLTDVYQQAMGKLTVGMFEALKPAIDELTTILRENGAEWEKWGSIVGSVTSGVVQGISAILNVFGPFVSVLGTVVTWLEKLNVNWDIIIIGIGALLLFVPGLNVMYGVVVLISEAIIQISKIIRYFKEEALAAAKAFNAQYADIEASENRRRRGVSGEWNARITITNSQEAIDKVEKLIDLLRKYQDEWAMIQAKNLVASEKNIYAVANLENELRIRKMNEEFQGQDSLLKKALAIQKLIHEDAIDKINMQLKAKEQALLKEAALEKAKGDAQALQFIINNNNAFENLKSEFEKMVNPQMDDPMQKLIGQMEVERNRIFSEANQPNDQSVIGLIAQYEALDNMIRMLKDRLAAGKLLAKEEEDRIQGAIDTAKKIKDADDATAWALEGWNARLLEFTTMTQGDPQFWEDNKVAAVKAFEKDGNRAEGVGRMALAGLEGTDIGLFISLLADAKDPMQAALNLIIEGVKESKTFQMVTNFAHIAIKAFADAIDAVVGWLFPSTEKMEENQKALDDAFTALIKSINEVIASMQDSIDQTISALKDVLSSRISSLRDLYEVGAITGSQYAEQSKAAYSEMNAGVVAAALTAGKTQSEAQKLADSITGPLMGSGNKSLSDLFEKLQAQLVAMGGVTAVQAQIDNLKEEAVSGGDSAKFDALHTQIQSMIDGLKVSDSERASLQKDFDAVTKAAPAVIEDNSAQIAGTLVAGVAATVAVTAAILAAPVIVPIIAGVIALGAGIFSLGKYLGAWDVGSPNIPQDQLGMVHKGEGIIPATFMDSIRKGDLSLSGGGNGGGSVNVVVNVAGSVRTERDLATSIATEIYRQRRSGLLTV